MSSNEFVQKKFEQGQGRSIGSKIVENDEISWNRKMQGFHVPMTSPGVKFRFRSQFRCADAQCIVHMACRDVLLQVIFYRRRCFSFLSLRDYLGNRRTKMMCAREIPIRLRNPFVRTLLRYSSLGSSKYERKRICTTKVWVGPRSVTWGPNMMKIR